MVEVEGVLLNYALALVEMTVNVLILVLAFLLLLFLSIVRNYSHVLLLLAGCFFVTVEGVVGSAFGQCYQAVVLQTQERNPACYHSWIQ